MREKVMQRLPKGGFKVTGPSCPPIFITHLPSSGLNAAQEIFFGYKVKIEGIHVVPNLTSPAGLPFVGKTKPDLSQGPFALELFGRNCVTNALVNYLAVNIHGGVQWMAVPSELRDMEIDYLACSGSYVEVSIIFHGTIIGTSAENNTDKALPPYPHFLQLLSFGNDFREKVAKKGFKGKVTTQLLPPITTDQTPEMLMQNIIRNITPAGKTFSTRFKSKVLSSRSYVSFPIEPCASIVERGFEIDLETAFQTPEAILSHLHTFADLLQACYDGKDEIHIEKSEMHNLLEEETVTVLSTVLTHGLQLFFGFLNQADVDQEKFVELGGLLLRYARLLLANETTNGILRENGTWTSLLSLIRVMPALPTSILQSYLAMILDGCSFLSLLNEFISPTISGSSPYQDLIIVSIQVSPSDTLLTTLVTQILGQIALYENIQNFVSCAEESLSLMEQVAQKINWRHTAYEKIASDEAGDDATDALSRANEEEVRELDEFNEALMSAFESTNQFVKQTSGLLAVWKHWNEVRSITKTVQQQLVGDEDAIVQFMEKNDFIPALATLIHVAAVGRELRQVIDDLLPQRQAVFNMINELQQVLLDMYLMLKGLKCYEAMMIHFGELLLAPLSSSCNGIIGTWKEEIQMILSLSWSSLQFLTLSKKVVSDDECDLEVVLTHGTILINGLSLPQTQATAHQVIEKHLLADVAILLEKLLHIESELLSPNLRLVHDMLVKTAEKLITINRSDLNSAITMQAYEEMEITCKLLKEKDIERSNDLQVDIDNEDNSGMKVAERPIPTVAAVESELDSTLSQALTTMSNGFPPSTKNDSIELYDHQLSEAVKPLSIEVKASHLISRQQAKQYQDLLIHLSKAILSRQQQQSNPSFFRSLTVECRLQLIRQVVIRTLNVSLMTLNLVIASVFLSNSSLTIALATIERDNDMTSSDHNQLLSAMKNIDGLQMVVGNVIDIMLVTNDLLESMEMSHLPHDVVTSLLRALVNATITLSQPAVIAVDQAAFTDKVASFEKKVASFIAKSLVLHDALCAEVHRMIQRTLPDQRAPLIRFLSAIICKTDDKDRDLPHMLLTYYPQYEGKLPENKRSLAKFVIESLSSHAADVHDTVLQFVLAVTVKCSIDLSAFIYYELVVSIQSITTRYLQAVNSESTSNNNSNNNKAILQSILIRSLTLVESLFLVDSSSLPVLLLFQQGILHTLFLLVHAEGNVSLVAQQCLWTARSKLESLSHHIEAGIMRERLRGIVDMIAVGLVEVLPQVMKRCQDSTSCLMQGVHIIHTLPIHHLWLPFFKRLAAVGEGFTIEFISIKIWTAFEEAFQALQEGSEIRKQLASTTNGASLFAPGQVENIINMAHARFACASFTLKAILEIVLWAYESQRISLLTVSKAARSTLADCRKVIIRYQRMYTMWSTALVGDSNSTEVNNDKFEARHALISLSLRHLVEITNKITRYSLAREEKFSQAAIHQARDQSLIVEEHWNEMLMMIDLQRPFVDHEDRFQDLLLSLTNLPENSDTATQVSLLHHDLRQLALDSSISAPSQYKDRLLALATADGWEKETIRRKRKLVSVIYPGSGMFAEQTEEVVDETQVEEAVAVIIPAPSQPPMPMAPGSVERKPGMIPPPPRPPPMPMPSFQMNNRPPVLAGIPPPPIPPSRFPFPAMAAAAVVPAPPIPPNFAQPLQINTTITSHAHAQPQHRPDYISGSYDQQQIQGTANDNAASVWENHPIMTGASTLTPTALSGNYNQSQHGSYLGNAFIDPHQMQVQQPTYDQQQAYMMQSNDAQQQQYPNVVNGHSSQSWDPQKQQSQNQYHQVPNQQQQYQDRPHGRFGGQQGGDQGFGGRGRGGRGRRRVDQWQDGGQSGRGRGRGDYEGGHNNKFQRRNDEQSGSFYGNQQQQESNFSDQPWQAQPSPADPHQQFMIPMISPSGVPPPQFSIQQQQGQQQQQPHQGGGQRQAYHRS